MPSPSHNRLTRVVKRILDGLQVLMILALVLWPIAAITMSIGQSTDTWGADITVYSGFTLALDELGVDVSESDGIRQPDISGKGPLQIDTSSPSALYLFTLITELSGLLALFVIFQLRALFTGLVEGRYFEAHNSARIRNIGAGLLAWAVVTPLLQYIGGKAILKEYALNAQGIALFPALEVNGLAVLGGVALIIFAKVFDEAFVLYRDQQLTI